MDQHEVIQPLLTDYILGELTPLDRRRVETHLQECGACTAEVRDLTIAFQSIGLQHEPEAPPAHLRARVLQHLSQQAPGERMADARPHRRTLHPAWLAAAAAVIAALGMLLAISTQRTARVSEDLQIATADARRLAQQIATTEGQTDLAVAILTAADMRRIDLAGVDRSREVIARAYWSPTRGLLIVADRLPAPPAGRIYQVWLIGSSSPGPVSAGLIDAGQSGRGMLIVPTVAGVQGGTVTIAVTDEPPGGLPAPTGAKHLVGS
jgi:anti-sigma-K factor RskA